MAVAICYCFTKEDKLKPTEAKANIDRYQIELTKSWEELPPLFITSSVSGAGKDEILNFISENNDHFFKWKKNAFYKKGIINPNQSIEGHFGLITKPNS